MITTTPDRKMFKPGLMLATALLGINAWAATDSRALVEQGQRAFQKGAFSQAAADWQKAVESFRSQRNTNAEVLTSISLSSAYQSLGQQRRAVQVLEGALAQAEAARDPSRVTLVKSKLGAALMMTQEPQRAEPLLREALGSAKEEQNTVLSAAILNDLGNLLASEQKFSEALQAYEDSFTLAQQASNSRLAAESLCNAAATAARAGENEKAGELNTRALRETQKLDGSHAKAFLLLTAGQTDRLIKYTNAEPAKRLMLRAHDSFQQAFEVAQQIGDHAMETYALGYMAQLYELDGQLQTALNLTLRAAFTVRDNHKCVYLTFFEYFKNRPDKPVVKALRLGEVAVGSARFKVAAEFPHFCR